MGATSLHGVAARSPELAASVLSFPDAALYQNIFALQQDGKMTQADALIEKLGERELMGHVLYQRYMHPDYKTNYTELKSWLDLYGDHPEADKVYMLASKRKPSGSGTDLKKPVFVPMIQVHTTVPVQKVYASGLKRSPAKKSEVRAFQKQVTTLATSSKVDAAVKMLEKKSGSGLLDQVEYDELQARIAAAALYSGRYERAYGLARVSWKRSGDDVPMAGWVAGLSAWRKGHYRAAAEYFESAANSPYAGESLAAGSAYWAGRAMNEIGDRRYSDFQKKAAAYPRTFYGLIATTALGQDFDFNWAVPDFNKKYYQILADIPAGRRALALSVAGQTQLAEAELIRIGQDDLEVRDALMAFAAERGLPVLAMRLGGGDAESYTKSSVVPNGGYTIDPALIHAIARQESRFNPNAKSSKGATGLMQIMPGTASAMAGKNKYSLKDPKSNLELGQLYLTHLLDNKNVKGDLVSLLVAYNAGPGTLARWKAEQGEVIDPLLFIETIPYAETRVYVKKVLTNYWMYSLREQSRVDSLDAMAKGAPAVYEAPATVSYETAMRF
ncbi:MAG: lytic transglycosylase domain-containing protein [Alphaproteobacteria bacterium]